MNAAIPATPVIPAFLQRQTPEPRFLITDDTNLIITQGGQTITLSRADIFRMRAFFNRFDLEGDHADA